MAALGYFCLLRHVPTLELATEKRLSESLVGASANKISSSVIGYTATLSGIAASETEKQGLLALAAGTPGVRSVVDELKLNTNTTVKANDDNPIVGTLRPVTSSSSEAPKAVATEPTASESANEADATTSIDTPVAVAATTEQADTQSSGDNASATETTETTRA